MHLIKKSDFLYQKVLFTLNKNGEIGLKTLYGGILSIIIVIISSIASFYFIFRLILKKESSVIFSTKKDVNINLFYSNKLPFLFRLSDTYSNTIDPIKIYEIKANYWYSFINQNITIQNFINLTYKQCNIYEHLNAYKKYFINIHDVNTFYCLDIREDNLTLFGSYGGDTPYGYIHFDFFSCNNKTTNNSCFSKEKIKEILNDAYLDLRFIDYDIQSLNKKDVKLISVKSERIPISYSVFKRLWINFKAIKFISDNGIIFTRNTEDIFHQFSNLRLDTDIRDMENGNYPGNFFALTFSLNGEVSIFHRIYTKLQNVLVNIGGVIKFISFFCSLLNYYNRKNSYYKKIIKDFIIENNINKPDKKMVLNFKPEFTFNFNLDNSNQQFKNEIRKIDTIKKFQNKDSFIKKFKYTFLPIRLSTNKKNYQQITMYVKAINNRLNVINILNTLENFKKLEKIFLIKSKKKNRNSITEVNNVFFQRNNYINK